MKVFIVLSDSGDGSHAINWFKNTTLDQLYELVEKDPETWGSGDGLQYEELEFPDDFDFKAMGVRYWSDEEVFNPEFDEDFNDETT
jgi:hypothetical protein